MGRGKFSGRYINVWFFCDMPDCPAKDERMVAMGSPVGDKDSVPEGWGDWFAHGVLADSILLCGEHLAVVKKIAEAIPKARGWTSEGDIAAKVEIAKLFPIGMVSDDLKRRLSHDPEGAQHISGTLHLIGCTDRWCSGCDPISQQQKFLNQQEALVEGCNIARSERIRRSRQSRR